MIYFTSDLHLWNDNIIGYEGRPYYNSEKMTKELVELQNDTLKDEDILYDIGDFSLKSATWIKLYEQIAPKFRKIKGRHLILGNHDSLKPMTYVNLELFNSVHTAFWFEHTVFGSVYANTYKFILCHDPCVFQPGLTFDIGICGHVHKLFKEITFGDNKPIINVGVDVRDYKPISIEDIINIAKPIMEKKCEK